MCRITEHTPEKNLMTFDIFHKSQDNTKVFIPFHGADRKLNGVIKLWGHRCF